jgi:hypothetical protein
MRKLRFRLKTVMIIVAFAALILTVVMQSVLLRRAAIREQLYRNQAERERDIAVAEAMRARALAQQALEHARLHPQEQERQP